MDRTAEWGLLVDEMRRKPSIWNMTPEEKARQEILRRALEQKMFRDAYDRMFHEGAPITANPVKRR
jgi:uncharacterized protein YnzC (UPF0291/DUF896 family)